MRLEKGTPSKETNEFLSSLDIPLEYENHADVVKLFAKNDDVDLYNYQRLINQIDNEKSENIIGLDPYILNSFSYLSPI